MSCEWKELAPPPSRMDGTSVTQERAARYKRGGEGKREKTRRPALRRRHPSTAVREKSIEGGRRVGKGKTNPTTLLSA